jgi:hypothetical protein
VDCVGRTRVVEESGRRLERGDLCYLLGDMESQLVEDTLRSRPVELQSLDVTLEVDSRRMTAGDTDLVRILAVVGSLAEEMDCRIVAAADIDRHIDHHAAVAGRSYGHRGHPAAGRGHRRRSNRLRTF